MKHNRRKPWERAPQEPTPPAPGMGIRRSMQARTRHNKIGQLGGELDIERKGPTPAEIDEKREAGRENDVIVPVLQSRWAAVSIALVVLSLLMFIVSLGEGGVFVVWFVCSVATFVWWIICVKRWIYLEEVNFNSILGALLLTLIIGTVATGLLGFLYWCMWRVATLVIPPVNLPEWMWLLEELWCYISPLIAFVGLVYSVWFFLHVELAFSQKLAQKSVFQEQNIWGAVGSLLTSQEAPWWWTARNKQAARAHTAARQVIVTITRRDASGTFLNEQRLTDCPLDDDKMTEVAHYILQGGRFSENACVGIGILSQGKYQETRDWMIKAGLAEWKDQDNHNGGVVFTEDGIETLKAIAPEPVSVTPATSTPPYDGNGGTLHA